MSPGKALLKAAGSPERRATWTDHCGTGQAACAGVADAIIANTPDMIQIHFITPSFS